MKLHHYIADYITQVHGNRSTAVRANVDKASDEAAAKSAAGSKTTEKDKAGVKVSEMYRKVGMMYSYYQVRLV